MKYILVVLAMTTFLCGCGANKLPKYDEQVKAAWSEVINQYQRRSDLIPALIDVVKASSAYESETLARVVAARARIEHMEIKKTSELSQWKKQYEIEQNNVETELKNIIAHTENYPALQANQDFLSLLSELEGTENRIVLARREYVMAVQIYNTELRTYPGKIWAAILYRQMKPRENYSLDN
jgi:LemA protein